MNTSRPSCTRCRSVPRNPRWRRRHAILLTLLLFLALTACSVQPKSSSAGRHAPSPSTKAAKVLTVKTWLGTDGVESSAVIAENRRTGTSSWQITNQGNGLIEGFASLNYAKIGDSVTLYVSTDQPGFNVIAYRMGWYQGLGGRRVWESASIPGHLQPACPVDTSTNMVNCENWSPSLTFPVTSAFVPGDYLLKLVASDNRQSYVLLTVWDPDSTAAYLVMNRSLVEQGWNTYGGYSFYQGQGACIIDSYTYPPCNRARVDSFDRPYDPTGSSDFLTNEYPLVQFMEEEGLDVTYCTDICISEHPTILLRHKALIAPDHDETWTNSERVAALDAMHLGVNMVFLGAATLVRHARLQSSSIGPDREEVDYRNPDEDPLNGRGSPWEVTGNTWASPPTNWDSSSFVGEIYSGFLEPGEPNAPIVVYDASSWIFKGTGLKKGESIPSAINSDFDHIDPQYPMPSDLQVLAHSPIPLSESYTNQGNWGGFTYSDMTYYTDPTSKAGVFDSGDNVWVAALRPCPRSSPACPSGTLRKMTANILWLFGQGPAGRMAPSVANWQTVMPQGS